MRLIKLYSPAIVLGLWALLWWAGVRGEGMIGACMTLTAVAVVVAENERRVIRKELHSDYKG